MLLYINCRKELMCYIDSSQLYKSKEKQITNKNFKTRLAAAAKLLNVLLLLAK